MTDPLVAIRRIKSRPWTELAAYVGGAIAMPRVGFLVCMVGGCLSMARYSLSSKLVVSKPTKPAGNTAPTSRTRLSC